MIQTIFKNAYDSNMTEIQNYLFKLDLPTTDTNLSEALTSTKELDNSSKLKANKSPGNEGFPNEWSLDRKFPLFCWIPLTGHLRLLSRPRGGTLSSP